MDCKKLICGLLVAMMVLCEGYAQDSRGSVKEWWVAGEQLLEGCDAEELFTAEDIDSAIFQRIKGLSYKDNCTVPLSELRYLRVVHYNVTGQVTMGEMICNKAISEDILYIFKALFVAQYPIESVRLIDDFGADDNLSMINNNSSSFNFRFISGTTKLSNHSRGLAVDINPLYNPYVKQSGDKVYVEPTEATPYVDRTKDFPYKIDTSDLCYKLFTERGFEWGGNWQSLKDYQHFEKSLK